MLRASEQLGLVKESKMQPWDATTISSRFQYFSGARPLKGKFAVIVSQIYSVLDRVVESDVLVALRSLYSWFVWSGFPRLLLKKAAERISSVHPFLRRSLLNALP